MYFGILQLLEEMGIRVVEIPSDPGTGMDLGALADALSRIKISAVLAIPNVNNPLGSVMPDEAKQELVWLLDRHDVPLIEDDVYGDLLFDGTRPRPVKAFDRDGRVLYCGSVSKTLAPGYRVGWVAPGRYQSIVERLKFTQSIASPTLMQMAVAELLAGGIYDRHLRRLRRTLAGQVERVRDAIGRHFPAGTRVSAPRGGFVLWVEFPEGTDAFELQARAFENGIAIAPGPIFSARNRFSNYVRLSCGFPWSERTARALEKLGELASELPRRRARKSA
jgi:DNA-binding transcriptional MocR family regulator